VSEADAISVNFHANDADALAEHQLAAGETAGFAFVDGADWNNISVGVPGLHDPAGTLFPTTPLKDNAGNSSAATVSPSASTTWFTGYCASSAAIAAELGLPGNDDDLFNSYLGLNGPNGDGTPADAAILEITGLGPAYTSGGYSLILYSDTDKGPVSGDRTTVFTVTPSGGSPIVVLAEDDASSGASTFDGAYVLSDNADTGSDYSNYTLIEGLSAASFTLEITTPGDGGRGGLCGFQIVAGTVTPAPIPDIDSFTSDTSSVTPGTQIQLSWDAPTFDTLTLDPGGIDAGALSTNGIGSTTFTVNETTNYTLTATLGSKTVQSELTVFARTISDRPNVLVFLVDDMGITDTSVPFVYDGAGNPVTTNFNDFYVTPNMDTLAGMGMKFTQAYATPACTSTRVSLMTGYNTLRHGVCMQVNPTGAIAPYAVRPRTTTHSTPNNWKRTGMVTTDTSMPQVLSDAGYRTIHCGKGHFGANSSFAADPLAVGFDVNLGGSHRGQPSSYTGNYGGNLPNMEPWENTGTFLTDALTQAMNGAIEDAVNDGVPFFAYMSHYAVHSPFTTDPNATGDYSAGVNGNHRAFATMIEGMDQSLGALLVKLDELGVAENTLIIFLGDNGSDSPAATQGGLASGSFSDFPLRGKKGTGWEGGVRVPMLVAWAKSDATNAFQTALPIAPGSREDDIVTVWDILPTVLGVTGVAPPHALDGHSLSPYLQGAPGTHRPQEMLIYWPNDHNDDFFALYREVNWKLIYRFAPNTFELYDLSIDPTESNDVAGANSERVMTMARSMARQFEGGWGPLGVLWPTFDGDSRPYTDDPFQSPQLPTVDVDMDGIPDNDEDLNDNGLLDSGETDPENEDSDDDGFPDGAELRTGTDPLDASSFFKLAPLPAASGNFIIEWPSRPGALYLIESSQNLDAAWAPVADDLPADAAGNMTSYDLGPTTSPDRNFFRVTLKD
jgi:arylsulfatase A-like enzyme